VSKLRRISLICRLLSLDAACPNSNAFIWLETCLESKCKTFSCSQHVSDLVVKLQFFHLQLDLMDVLFVPNEPVTRRHILAFERLKCHSSKRWRSKALRSLVLASIVSITAAKNVDAFVFSNNLFAMEQ